MDTEIKIYFTVMVTILLIIFASFILMNEDSRREDMWFKIGKISWISLMVLVIGGFFYNIWVLS